MALGQSRSSASFLATPNRTTRRQAARAKSESVGGHASSTGNLAYEVDSSQTGKLPRKGGPRSIIPLMQLGEEASTQISQKGRHFADGRLQQFADEYEREVSSFASVALHAEVKLNQLELLGALPNKLALAVSMDVLRRLGEVGGRYQDLIIRIHDAILPHCYMEGFRKVSLSKAVAARPLGQTLSAVSEPPNRPKRPSSLSEYLRQDAVFDFVEGTKRENAKILRELERMKTDHLHSLRFLEDSQRTELVRQAIHSAGPFGDRHLKGAVSQDSRAALMSVWDKVWRTADPTAVAGHIKAMLNVPFKKNGKTAKQEFLNEVMLHLWNKNPAYVESANSPRRKKKKGPAEEEGAAAASEKGGKEEEEEVGPGVSHVLDEKVFGWLLARQRQQECTDLVDLLKENIDKDQVVVTEVPLDGRRGGNHQTSRRAALEKFLLGAGEDDISLLRTMVLTWDFQNGVEWKLITGADREEEEKRLEEEEMDRRRLAAEEAAREAELAHKAIFSFKTNVAGKMAAKLQKKKKLATMMAKFRTAALTTVRMAGVLDGVRETRTLAGPQDKNFQANASDIKKELARHLKELLRKAGKDSEAAWACLLDDEILASAAHDNNSKKKGKKQLFSHNCMPRIFGAQMTSFRMAYKDIKRMRSKKPPALLRIASDIFVLHASIFKNKHTQHGARQSRAAGSAAFSLQQDTAFAKTVYMYFLEKYGLPEIADANMVGLASALVKHRHDHPRLNAFARMCFNEVNAHVSMGYAVGICVLAEASLAEGSAPDNSAANRRISVSSSPKATRRRRSNSSGKGKSPSPTRRSSSGSSSSSSSSSGGKNKNGKDKAMADFDLEIPISEAWCVSVSAVKASMAVTMKSVRDTTWNAFLADIEAEVANHKRLAPTCENEAAMAGVAATSAAAAAVAAAAAEPLSPKSKGKSSAAGTEAPNKSNPGSKKALLSARRRMLTQVTRGHLKKKLGGNAKAQPYSISKKDFTSVLPADIVLETFLKHWSTDLKKKEDHLAKMFMSADIDGDGELTASEFTALVHSVDPEVPVKRAVEMYRSALRQSENESIDPDGVCSRVLRDRSYP